MDDSSNVAPVPYTPVEPGAVVLPNDRARITVKSWARSVAVQLDRNGWKRTVEMPEVARHLFSVEVDQFTPGDRYAFVFDGNHGQAFPDPRSRYQPDGVHGMSQLTDPTTFQWTDASWRNIRREDLIIYEMHVGTCTTEGTFRSAIDKIEELVQLGITAIELLPVCQSAGRWNWGYDGVNFFAPYQPYGTPDDLKAFVNACHDAGLALILDVVYNHPGPEGNYLSKFGPYFSAKHATPWGPAYNFDGRSNALARSFFIDNAIYWLDEFHFDGLRLDAIHFMFDDLEMTIVEELSRAVRAFGRDRNRHYFLIGETNVFDGNMIKSIEEGGLGFDAIWCDDLMHGLYSIGTPETQLTERKYQGLGDVAEALQHGYLFSGPPRKRIARDEDTVADRWCVPSLVVSTQTHDSVGNQPLGKRLHHLAGVDFQMAASALSLLYPGIPMLFMGEETAEPNPFHYFVDFGDPWLKKAIENGRRHEHPQQDWAETVSPLDEQAFAGSRLTDVDANAEDRIRTREWYRRLIQIRRVWIELGLLQPNNLRVESDKGNQQVTLRYQSDPHQSSVWVQLAGEPDMTAAAALEQASKNLPGQVIASTFCSDETDPVPKTFAIVTSTKNE